MRLNFRRDWSRDHWGHQTWTRILGHHALLLETHELGCECSYCQRVTGRVGLWLPQIRAWNSWRVIYVRGWRCTRYLRWTWGRRPDRGKGGP